MEAIPKRIRLYKSRAGKRPFIEWLDSLRDEKTKQKIQLRIDRLSLGNPGDTRPIGDGVHELKINYGPVFRVYFGYDGFFLVILVLGGNKSSQHEDIQKAKKYWKAYKEEDHAK